MLLNYLRNDPRWEIKLKALKDLHLLAKPGAHLWPPNAIDDIIDFVLDTKQSNILVSALSMVSINVFFQLMYIFL